MKKQVDTRTFYFYNLKYKIIIYLLFIDKYIQNKYSIHYVNKTKLKEGIITKDDPSMKEKR